jgi:hypothetical protein
MDYNIYKGILMEYVNRKVFNIDGTVDIYGKWKKHWFDNNIYTYDCKVEYPNQLFYYSFFEYDDKIEWHKNQRIWITPDKNIKDMVYISLEIHKDSITKNGFPEVYNGKMDLGKLFLFAEYNGIKRYLLFLNEDAVKMDRKREYIWRIRKSYINEENEILLNKIRVHRKGIINLLENDMKSKTST